MQVCNRIHSKELYSIEWSVLFIASLRPACSGRSPCLRNLRTRYLRLARSFVPVRRKRYVSKRPQGTICDASKPVDHATTQCGMTIIQYCNCTNLENAGIVHTLKYSLVASWYSFVMVCGSPRAKNRTNEKRPKEAATPIMVYAKTFTPSPGGVCARGPCSPNAM